MVGDVSRRALLHGTLAAAVASPFVGSRAKVRSVDKAALSRQQMMANTFYEAGLIPRKIVTGNARIWKPAPVAAQKAL